MPARRELASPTQPDTGSDGRAVRRPSNQVTSWKAAYFSPAPSLSSLIPAEALASDAENVFRQPGPPHTSGLAFNLEIARSETGSVFPVAEYAHQVPLLARWRIPFVVLPLSTRPSLPVRVQ